MCIGKYTMTGSYGCLFDASIGQNPLRSWGSWAWFSENFSTPWGHHVKLANNPVVPWFFWGEWHKFLGGGSTYAPGVPGHDFPKIFPHHGDITWNSQTTQWFRVFFGGNDINFWVVVWNISYFHLHLGKIPMLTNVFQLREYFSDWCFNHQPDSVEKKYWVNRLAMNSPVLCVSFWCEKISP